MTICIRYRACWDSLHVFDESGSYVGDVDVSSFAVPASTGHCNDWLRRGRNVRFVPATDPLCLARVETCREHLAALRRGETVKIGRSTLKVVQAPRPQSWREP